MLNRQALFNLFSAAPLRCWERPVEAVAKWNPKNAHRRLTKSSILHKTFHSEDWLGLGATDSTWGRWELLVGGWERAKLQEEAEHKLWQPSTCEESADTHPCQPRLLEIKNQIARAPLPPLSTFPSDILQYLNI
ncbi:MAG: hypothetical protein AUG51_14010 [Acidobacteria bacterium 13_1_20CM_3_53_8]|nr:MAG: hypothetical protein AUG51_14010 [Acidobacteria bacterium 13_1_20CM_3_53_8]